MAAAALIHSCATLESSLARSDDTTSPQASDVLVEESKKIYAARLAVCELHDAKITVPQQCQSFLPTFRSAKKRSFRGLFTKDGPSKPHVSYPEYEELTELNLDSCLSSLHSYGAGQGWTSYSNNKKNAVAMCHAVRGELEKDEQINLFKILLSSTVGVEGALSRSKQEWVKLRSDFKELKSGMRQLFVDLQGQDTQRQEAAASLWEEATRQMKEGMNEVLHTVDHLQQKIAKSSDSIDSLSQRMEGVVTENSEQWGEATASLTNAIMFAQELIQQKVLKAVYDASEGVIQTNELVATTNHQLTQHFAQHADYAEVVKAMGPMLASVEESMLRIHGDQIQKHIELQAYANKTQVTLERANVEAEKLLGWATFFTGLAEDWLSILIPYLSGSAVFCGTLIVTTMVAFAIWRSVLPIGFFGTCLLALVTGFATTGPLTSVIGFDEVSKVGFDILRPNIEGIIPYVGGIVSAVFMMQVFKGVRGYLHNRKSRAPVARTDLQTRPSIPATNRDFSLPCNNQDYIQAVMKKSFGSDRPVSSGGRESREHDQGWESSETDLSDAE
nr:hypothetical protein CFP56_71760 [Quercus suber]